MREIRMLRTTWRELETELRDGLRHRRMAKAAGKRLLPVPMATAPAFDPTKENYSQWIYFNRYLRIYDNDTIYCFKPMQAFHWTQRQAILDAGEVIAETLTVEENV